MKPLKIIPIVLLLALVRPASLAQNWEVGAAAGYSLFRNVTATSPAGTASAGFANGPLFSLVAGQYMREHLGGEFRYTYTYDDLKVSGSGQTARLNGESHSFEYDLTVYAQPRESTVRLFAEVGGGARLFRGTGRELPYQPLANVAVPTQTKEMTPVVSFGGGVKIRAGHHALFRIDLRDVASAFPKNVIAPAPPGGKITGWLHDAAGMFGISFIF